MKKQKPGDLKKAGPSDVSRTSDFNPSPRGISLSSVAMQTQATSSPTCVAIPNHTLIGAQWGPAPGTVWLEGVSGTITTKDPWIACLDDSSSTVIPAFSLAFANMSIDDNSSAQIGVIKWRNTSTFTVQRNVYIELRNPGISNSEHRVVYYFDPPPLTEDWTYTLTFNMNTGSFAAIVNKPDGTRPYNITIPSDWFSAFKNKAFVSASWCGEKRDLQSYIPGFNANRCVISNLQIKKISASSWTTLGHSDLSPHSAPTNSDCDSNLPSSIGNVEVWDTRAPHP